MDQNFYVEDIFCEFYQESIKSNKCLGADKKAAENFYFLITNNKSLTKNQANYLVKILRQNHKLSSHDSINDLKWKNTFRVIDSLKKISIIEDHYEIFYAFQFPYSFKEIFDKAFVERSDKFGVWDTEKKVRKLKFYDHNILKILAFCQEHDFLIDESFLDVLSLVEEFYDQECNIVPFCEIKDNFVDLKNAEESTTTYWNLYRTGNIEKDLLLAKSMGFVLKKDQQHQGLIEKICLSKNNNFWIDKLDKFFEIYHLVDTKVCIILDRNVNIRSYIEFFVEESQKYFIPKNHIKVCFRQKNEGSENINKWIHDNGLGGKINEGKIFFFLHAPPKWFYKDIESFKIILFHNIIPYTNNKVQQLMYTHPLVIHTENIKPTKTREIEIEEL